MGKKISDTHTQTSTIVIEQDNSFSGFNSNECSQNCENPRKEVNNTYFKDKFHLKTICLECKQNSPTSITGSSSLDDTFAGVMTENSKMETIPEEDDKKSLSDDVEVYLICGYKILNYILTDF